MSVMDCGMNIFFLAIARSQDKTVIGTYMASPKDANKETYHSTVREVLNAPDFSAKTASGARYRLVGVSNALNFIMDEYGRVYVAITSAEYPERLVFPMLNEIAEKFNADPSLTGKANQIKEGGLTKKLKPLLSNTASDYDDPAKKDKIAAVQSRVEEVRITMQSNVDTMLQNLNKAEEIQSDSERLQKQTEIFHGKTQELERSEKWKSRKLTILITLIILVILTVLIITLIKQ